MSVGATGPQHCRDRSGDDGQVHRERPVVDVVEVEAGVLPEVGVAAAVQKWVASTPEKYRFNAEFEEFKAIAWKLENDDFPEKH